MNSSNNLKNISDIIIHERFRKDNGDITSLINSIKEVGLLHPVVVNEDNVLIAGKRRLEAARRLGWQTIPVNIVTLKEVLKGEVQENMVRKNFTSSERATIAKIMVPEVAIESTIRMLAGVPCDNLAQGKTRDKVAAFAGISHGTLAKDIFIDNAVEKYPEKIKPIQEAIDNGDLTVNAGYMKTKAIVNLEKVKQIELPKIPDGKYQCIVIDPPWPMHKISREVRPNQTEELDYPTMTIEAIQNLPIKDLVSENCHIYLWTTHHFLPDALQIFKTWDVNYECLLTWVKNVGFTPFSWMYNTEHVLFGRIGNLKLTKLGIKLSFEAQTTKHSEKPDVFYEIVKQASPEPRLDMFQREPHEGFKGWGNETEQ